MTALRLRRVDPARNMCRFYRLDVQSDLFGGVLLVKEWGRIGAQGRTAARADADAQPLDDAFWANAPIVMPQRIPKKHQGMRLDSEVIDWFKAQGPGWQTRMNAVLRSARRSKTGGASAHKSPSQI
jgi:uncharacterized protein (DUF4415 family)